MDFTWRLFRAQGVSVLDASAFGKTANGFVRLGFGSTKRVLPTLASGLPRLSRRYNSCAMRKRSALADPSTAPPP
ncbi:MAG: Aspartate aminotransferase (EC [uncultured Paraburkholderia sp.]|nr:MAG: Aspartate aminotransferase (EC [uncultured Paraburkholderia sp.]CAH2932129.1 MAG: Aspartate aminotransferase (EC [uncultured Paraburkholderia sp.]